MKKTSVMAICAGVAALSEFSEKPEVTRYEIRDKKLPQAFDGFRLVHLSDYHNAAPEGTLALIREEKPDAIMLTGDMTNEFEPSTAALRFLERLLEIAPCYMVSGNHDIYRTDYAEYVSACRARGAVYLRDERIFLRRGTERIALTGMEDLFYKTEENMRKAFEKAAACLGCAEEFEILLFHRANLLDWVAETNASLILAGHLHGGQIRIPGIGGVLCPKSGFSGNTGKLFPNYSGGCYRVGDSWAVVNRGLGNTLPLPRFFNRPEVGSIVLRTEREEINT